jgi:hypothetical protein
MFNSTNFSTPSKALLVKFNNVSKFALFAAAICSGVNVMISPSKLKGEQ